MAITTLPTTPVKPTESSRTPRRTLLFGNPKIGKSKLLSQCPGLLLIDLEDNASHLECMRVSPANLGELLQTLNLVRAKPGAYSGIAIDTITKLEEWVPSYALNRYRSTVQGKNFTGSSVMELPPGLGYYQLREAFTYLLEQIYLAHPRVILMGHTRDSFFGADEVKLQTAGAKSLALTGKNKEITIASVNLSGLLLRKDNTIWLDLRAGTQDIGLGTHIERLAGYYGPFSWDLLFDPNFMPKA